MVAYLVNRILWSIVVLFGVLLVVFMLIRVVPGDPVLLMYGDSQGASPEVLQAARVQLGLDRPLYVQFVVYLGHAVTGDFGESFRYHQPAIQLVLKSLPYTLELSICAFVVSVLLGSVAGIVAAMRRGSGVDHVIMLGALLGQSVPTFWLGIILIIIFAVKFHLFPTSGHGSWRYLVLPTVTLSGFLVALTARLVRSSMLDVLGQDYVRTARSKGLADRTVIFRHAFRNALIPVVTVLGLQISTLLGGAVVTEAVFALPGIGTLAVNAINTRDYNVLQAVVLLSAMIFVVVNLAVDILYTQLDPRIRLSR